MVFLQLIATLVLIYSGYTLYKLNKHLKDKN